MDDVPIWKQELLSGYREFRTEIYPRQKKLYQELGKKGQNPNILVISCSDSRANPSDIFNAYPGEIFVVRNIANIVPPPDTKVGYHGSSAAIEYAVRVLKVKAIVIMGHENCGGIQAYVEQRDTNTAMGESYVADWIKILDAAKIPKCDAKNDSICLEQEMEFAGIRLSLENLMKFSFVKSAVEAGELSLLGAYFSIIKGKLLFADEDGVFKNVPFLET
jgi:carbonic anhydrase